MDLSDAAVAFNNDRVLDAYTEAFLFYAHTAPHDDQTSSGATSRRRTLHTAPGTQPPARYAVKLAGDFWVIGGYNDDPVMGTIIRRSFDSKKSTGLQTRLSPAEACQGFAGYLMHTNLEYFKSMMNKTDSSDSDTFWNMFCGKSETVQKGDFFLGANGLLRVRNVYPDVTGYLVAEVDQFDPDAAQTITFTATGSRSIATDAVTQVATSVSAIQTDSQKIYKFHAEADAPIKPGDRAVIVAKADITPKVSSNFTMLGQVWRVLQVISERDCWALRVRLA